MGDDVRRGINCLPVGREGKKVLVTDPRFTQFSWFRVGLFERK
jgi:hypothetical protein